VARWLLYVGLFLTVMWAGTWFLRNLGRPLPPPPPPGELRRLRLRFRCSVCGAEVRMTAAAEEEPEPPRHCMEEMEVVPPSFD